MFVGHIGDHSSTNKINSLCFTSTVSVALALVFVFVAFVVAFIMLVKGESEAPRMVLGSKAEAPRAILDFGSKDTFLDLLTVIPIMSNTCVCYFNIQPI